MGAQVLSERLGVPSIVLLLAAGVAIGPDGLGLLDVRVFGPALSDLVSLAVTIILFEGGLALRVEELRQQQRSLVLLLTLGAAISMLVGTLAAHGVLGMSWSVAVLYGALMIVTGPTVVTPLLNRIRVDRPVKELLISEGVLIDPIGAVVAILAAEYVLGEEQVWRAGGLLFLRLGIGGLIGALAGLALSVVLRRGWVPDDLRNPVVLGGVLLAAGLAGRLSEELGLMAAVTQGVVMANTGLRELGRLQRFKEELTVVLLSFIFVLLAADLPLQALRGLGWQALLVVAILIWVARPLSVFLCTAGSGLTIQQRAFVAWVCPRGIVAASVAGLFAILLERAETPGGDQLEALVFVTVGLTVALQGLTARRVAHFLGVDLPALQGTVLIGADHFGRLLARMLAEQGRQVALVDSSPQHCRAARAEGLPVYQGDALSVEVLEEAGVRYADLVLAVTRNQELNTLVGQRVRDNFRVERVLGAGEDAQRSGQEAPFPGDFGGVDEVNRQLRLGRAQIAEYEALEGGAVGRRLDDLPYAPGEFALFLQRRDRFFVALGRDALQAGDRLLCLRSANEQSPLADLLRPVGVRSAASVAARS